MMKTTWLGILLTVFAAQAWAQVGELVNAEVIDRTTLSDPAEAMEAAEGQWLAFEVPAMGGTRSPCCRKGQWNATGEVGCSLENRHQSYGTHSGFPLTDSVIVFSEIRDGQVYRLRVVGETCPVEGNGATVHWLGDVDSKAGLDWLHALAGADSHDRAGAQALHALALHASERAGERLQSLALEADNDLAEEAIFWLGEARAEKGFKLLKNLLSKLPDGDRRRSINFALSQNNTAPAAELLLAISKSDHDPEQRAGAMFWLAQEYPQQAKGWLLEVVETEQDEDVLERAVFAISQLPDGDGDRLLLQLARNEQVPRHVRRQALFWLANSDNDDSIAALAELLAR